MKKVLSAILIMQTLTLTACFAAPQQTIVEIEPSASAPVQTPLPADTAGNTPTPAPVAREAWVCFLNAGKADCALICIDGRYWLVDTGTEDGADAVKEKLKSLGVAQLEGIFLTHTHKDHTGGAKAIAKAIPVAMFFRASMTELSDKGKDKLSSIAEKADVPETKLAAGDSFALGAARLEVLAPLIKSTDDDNDNSLVMRLSVNAHSVLFTGDMQFAEENTLLEAGIDVSSDILKVGNHGNPDATGDAFASAVSPQYAVISTDTRVDTDSANERVKAALSNAKIYTTEEFTVGVKFDLAGDAITVSDPGFDPAAEAKTLGASYFGMLVNRANQISADYVPDDLVKISDTDMPALAHNKSGIRGDRTATEALREMMAAASGDGVTGFLLVSVYRTYEEQQRLWDKKLAKDPTYGADENTPIVTAYPGASEHQTGLAFDISSEDEPSLSESFADTPQGRWLYANCHRFGFILRYPKGRESETVIVFEPWHFRYVGKPLSTFLAREGLTLEGFYKLYGE